MLDEVQNALKNVKNSKATDEDKKTTEILKNIEDDQINWRKHCLVNTRTNAEYLKFEANPSYDLSSRKKTKIAVRTKEVMFFCNILLRFMKEFYKNV